MLCISNVSPLARLARPACPSCSARELFVTARIIDSASLAGLLGGTTQPVTPFSITSGMPPTPVTITGNSSAIASSAALLVPSDKLDSTNNCEPSSSWRTCSGGSKPAKRTESVSPRTEARNCRASFSGPSPMMVNLASKPLARSSASALNVVETSLIQCSRPTVIILICESELIG